MDKLILGAFPDSVSLYHGLKRMVMEKDMLSYPRGTPSSWLKLAGGSDSQTLDLVVATFHLLAPHPTPGDTLSPAPGLNHLLSHPPSLSPSSV